jgi:hypothetical protein
MSHKLFLIRGMGAVLFPFLSVDRERNRMYSQLQPSTKVKVKIAVCPCTGKSHIIQVAKIVKRFEINGKVWYFLDNNRSVDSNSIMEVIK